MTFKPFIKKGNKPFQNGLINTIPVIITLLKLFLRILKLVLYWFWVFAIIVIFVNVIVII